MKRRIGSDLRTGLGGGRTLIDGQKTKDKKLNRVLTACARDAYATFFMGTVLDSDICDAQYRYDIATFGVEPTYQYDKLKVINIHRTKKNSTFVTGIARGTYGSQIAETKYVYKNYTRDCKFIRFVDKWHPKLYK